MVSSSRSSGRTAELVNEWPHSHMRGTEANFSRESVRRTIVPSSRWGNSLLIWGLSEWCLFGSGKGLVAPLGRYVQRKRDEGENGRAVVPPIGITNSRSPLPIAVSGFHYLSIVTQFFRGREVWRYFKYLNSYRTTAMISTIVILPLVEDLALCRMLLESQWVSNAILQVKFSLL